MAEAGAALAPSPTPLWQRTYLDILLLALAAILFWQSQNAGYQIVLAPEGVPQSSVDYNAFLAPLFLWIGIALFTVRFLRLALGRGRGFLTGTLHPVAGRLSGIVAASLSRQKNRLTRGVVLLLVANAAYVAGQTGSNAAEIVLLRATGEPSALAAAAREASASLPGVTVTDVRASLRLIQSSLTAVDLAGLTRLELVFAILMAVGSAGIVFALNLADRRRALVLLSALGATRRQIGAFIWSEALIILVVGLILGLATGAAVAQILVKMLTGVFDPPPQSLAIPWAYLLLLAACAILASIAAVLTTQAAARKSLIEGLKTL